jgi:hypothetical protein
MRDTEMGLMWSSTENYLDVRDDAARQKDVEQYAILAHLTLVLIELKARRSENSQTALREIEVLANEAQKNAPRRRPRNQERTWVVDICKRWAVMHRETCMD